MSPARASQPAVENALSPLAGDGRAVTIARLPLILAVPLCMLLSPLVSGAYADYGIGDEIEWTGRFSTETRLYPDTAAHPPPALARERPCREDNGLLRGRRGPKHHGNAVLPIRRRRSRPHPRRPARGLPSRLRRHRRRRVGAASGRRPGLLERRRIAPPGRHRQPDRPRGTPGREDQDGPADGPSYLVGGLGGAGACSG